MTPDHCHCRHNWVKHGNNFGNLMLGGAFFSLCNWNTLSCIHVFYSRYICSMRWIAEGTYTHSRACVRVFGESWNSNSWGIFDLFWLFFWPLHGVIDRTASEMTRNNDEVGTTRSKGPQARTPTWGCCSEDKASVHGTPALPSELMGAPAGEFYFCSKTE